MFATAPPLSQESITQKVSRDSARPACTCLIVRNRPVLPVRYSRWKLVNADQPSIAFDAANHDRYTVAPSVFTVSEVDEFSVPTRIVDEPGEIYNGPRGKLVVIKKR
jgi:hypothetical protein